jgi:hypothetical protein
MQKFSQPVAIFIGLGFPYDVETPLDALRVLDEWTGSRGPIHTMATGVCRSALAKKADTDAARLAFEAFARSRGLLAPDALDTAVQQAAEEWVERKIVLHP